MVTVVNGEGAEVDEVRPGPGMRVQFAFERNSVALRPAVVLTERGRQMGTAERYEDALSALGAAAVDPFDPDCRFHAAFSLAQLRRYAEAADEYGAVEGLAPGWFQCRSDRWAEDQLAAGLLDYDDFLALARLQDEDDPPKSKLVLSERLLDRRPDLPAGHLCRAKVLAALGRPAVTRGALLAGLAADPSRTCGPGSWSTSRT